MSLAFLWVLACPAACPHPPLHTHFPPSLASPFAPYTLFPRHCCLGPLTSCPPSSTLVPCYLTFPHAIVPTQACPHPYLLFPTCLLPLTHLTCLMQVYHFGTGRLHTTYLLYLALPYFPFFPACTHTGGDLPVGSSIFMSLSTFLSFICLSCMMQHLVS